MKFTKCFQGPCYDELHRFPRQEQSFVYILRDGMFPILSTPPQCHRPNSPTLISHLHVLVYLPCQNPQSSPAVGISFCLIIVRLGRVLPVAREETWDASVCTPASRTGESGQVAVEFPQIKVQRDVYVSESKDFPMGSLEARERGYVNSSARLPKIFRSSPSVSTLA